MLADRCHNEKTLVRDETLWWLEAGNETSIKSQFVLSKFHSNSCLLPGILQATLPHHLGYKKSPRNVSFSKRNFIKSSRKSRPREPRRSHMKTFNTRKVFSNLGPSGLGSYSKSIFDVLALVNSLFKGPSSGLVGKCNSWWLFGS